MAFCNSCGTTLEPGARFCPKCGASIPMAGAIAPPPVAAAPPAPVAHPPAQGSSALKIILIVIGVIFLLGILGIGTMVFVVRRTAHNSHFQNKDGNLREETHSALFRAHPTPTKLRA